MVNPATDNPARDDEIEALCARAASGDLDAAERLLWLHHQRLLGTARRKIGVDWQGRIEAEDLLQEAYIDILRQISGFKARDSESFYRWAVRIVDHKFIDQVRLHRRAKRDIRRELAGNRQSLLGHVMGRERGPSQILRQQDAEGALMSCLARLPEEARTVVTRRHLGQENFSTIAADLGKSEDAVRRMCARAVDRLRECMGRASKYLSAPP